MGVPGRDGMPSGPDIDGDAGRSMVAATPAAAVPVLGEAGPAGVGVGATIGVVAVVAVVAVVGVTTADNDNAAPVTRMILSGLIPNDDNVALPFDDGTSRPSTLSNTFCKWV